MPVTPSQVSSLLGYLPGVFQDDRGGRDPNFLGRFLLGFEKLLLGLGDPDPKEAGLEEIVARLYRYFDPGEELEEGERAPREFLPWLAGWLALVLREDWDEPRQRHLIANASRLYRLRGTKQGVGEFIRIYTGAGYQIDEYAAAFQIGTKSTVGVDTRLGGGPPFFFHVRVRSKNPDPAVIEQVRRAAVAIVDLQKPAHTFYTLKAGADSFQINVHSTVGVDTLLSSPMTSNWEDPDG